MIDISIIILNYKQKGFVLNCLKSIGGADFGELKKEIIVIDNNSEDALGEILSWQNPEVIFIQNKKNIGMGAGNNVGIKKAKGKYIAVMNPDTIAQKSTFLTLFKYLEDNIDVGLVGPKQLNPDRSIQFSCYRRHGLLTPLYRRTPLSKCKFAQKDIDRFLMKDFDHQEIKEVDWLLGSFLFCRSEVLKRIGFFDERYFMYFEDADVSRSFWKKGFKVVYNPKTEIIHNHTRQSAQIAWYKFFTNKATRWHIISWIKYLMKWGIKVN